jgi:DNA mismatch repair protein MutL
MADAAVLTRKPIRKLPPLLVNQIAAGEVVERPSSVVKELVENAIDAGSKRISIELEQGGIELIRIADDGVGIPPDELPLAIAPHATSKISTPDDLDRIGTMGFRGEAIASIASVSRLSIRSRSGDQAGANVIEVEGDTTSAIKPAPGPIGTVVTVRNLFFNTPARRKFLRTPATEQGHCVDAACTLAIAHPHIAFTVIVDGRTTLSVPGDQGPRDRALSVLGPELADQMLECSLDRFDDARGLAIWGLVGLPSIARATAKGQHVFLNGRPIRDKVVQHALREAYRGLIEPGRYPTTVLMIEMDPGAVDVNVHPAKTEVRFRDQSMVHSAILRAVRDVLQAQDLTPNLEHSMPWRSGGAPMFGPGHGGQGPQSPGGSGAPSESPINHAQFADFFKRDLVAQPQHRFEFQAVRDAMTRVAPELVPAQPVNADASVGQAPCLNDGEPSATSLTPRSDASTPATHGTISHAPESAVLPTPEIKDRLLQVHNSYVVTQDEQGLLIVDQHALHERVMFELLLARVTGAPDADNADVSQGKPLESQSLLIPTNVPVTRAAAAKLDDLRPLLERIGIQAELLSPEAVGIHAFPTFLFDRGVDPGEFLRELFEKAEADGFAPASEQALHEVLDMMACKAAIKAGNHLSDTELADLLRLRSMVERSSNCPHGRPTSIRLTIRELEKRFGRG